MAAKGIRAGKSYKEQYKKYLSGNVWEKNLIIKLERTVKNQPNNEQAKVALNKALAGNATYSRNKNNSSDHPCKGMNSIFGYVKNKVPQNRLKSMCQSKIWYTSTDYSNWFLPSAPKDGKTANNAVSIWDQFIELGFKAYGRKSKKSTR